MTSRLVTPPHENGRVRDCVIADVSHPIFRATQGPASASTERTQEPLWQGSETNPRTFPGGRAERSQARHRPSVSKRPKSPTQPGETNPSTSQPDRRNEPGTPGETNPSNRSPPPRINSAHNAHPIPVHGANFMRHPARASPGFPSERRSNFLMIVFYRPFEHTFRSRMSGRRPIGPPYVPFPVQLTGSTPRIPHFASPIREPP